jgi:hypothetical protein
MRRLSAETRRSESRAPLNSARRGRTERCVRAHARARAGPKSRALSSVQRVPPRRIVQQHAGPRESLFSERTLRRAAAEMRVHPMPFRAVLIRLSD